MSLRQQTAPDCQFGTGTIVVRTLFTTGMGGCDWVLAQAKYAAGARELKATLVSGGAEFEFKRLNDEPTLLWLE